MAISGELQALVDAGVITTAQAIQAAREAPGPNEFRGYARCMNVGCEERETDRSIQLRRTVKQEHAPDIPVLIGQTEHVEVVNDSDLACPECGEPCAILEQKPPTYARLAPA